MIVRVFILWVVGLLTIVPFGLYQLFFHAQRGDYAFLITVILFWIFGFWGVLAPILAIVKIRQVQRALEMVRSKEQLLQVLRSPQAYELLIDFVAADNRLPKFVAKKILALILKRLSAPHPAGMSQPPPNR
jgi:hypothetical protein